MAMCETCGYHWKEEDERYPRCHFDGPDGSAPCETEEDDYIHEAEE